MDKKIFFFVGTVAELIKLGPIFVELNKRKVEYEIISSGQNDLGLKELKPIFGEIKVGISLSPRFSQEKSSIPNFLNWTVKTLIGSYITFRKEFPKLNKNNSYFVVHGDTVSSLVGALAAKCSGFCVAHVESGLRSFDFLEPFPEEICRYVISKVSDVHFCPNKWSIDNLSKFSSLNINTGSNTVSESLEYALKKDALYPIPKELKGKKYFLLSIHRQEHVMFQKSSTISQLKLILKLIPNGLNCVILMHKLTENFAKNVGIWEELKKNPSVTQISRQPYGVFANIMSKCEFMVTDGGSNQEEAYYLGKPCLILRNKTERIEGLGKNVVLAKGSKKIINKFMSDYKEYSFKSFKNSERPSKIIVDYLVTK